MTTSSMSKLAWLTLLVMAALPMAQSARAGEASDTLKAAIGLFDQGEYLAAQEKLTAIDRDQLSDKDRDLRDDYVNRIQVAITMEDKALRDLEDAETAIEDDQLEQAEALLNAVIHNEYADKSLRTSAVTKLQSLQDGAGEGKAEVHKGHPQAPVAGDSAVRITESEDHENPSESPTRPHQSGPHDQVRALLQEGHALVQGGRYDAAATKFQDVLALVPGHPDAVDGLRDIQLHRANASAPQGRSLVERIRQQDAVNWQRTVAQYRDMERAIREHVSASRFDEARQLLIRARQIVQSGKQFADPIVKYENLRDQLQATESQVVSSERVYNEKLVAEKRREVTMQRSKKLREIEDRRARQVDQLWQQAMELRKDGDLDDAVNTLRQVLTIDRKNQPARFAIDTLEEELLYKRQRASRKLYRTHTHGALLDVETSKVPWWQDINYPDDWPERIMRPERHRPRETGANSRLISSLDAPVRVDFQQEPFRKVMEHLADAHKLNIIVNWHDIHGAGVEDDVTIDLNLPNEISLRKVFTEVLSQAGAGAVDLGFEVSDGAITVATQQMIDSRTYPAVYPISDLLMDIPSFNNAPMQDLRDAMKHSSSSSRQRRLPWEEGDDLDDEPEEDLARQARVDHFINLIQDTVAPDSWRDRGGTIGTINEVNQQLVITQNSAAQRQIGGLLDKLREQRAVQISVEAIFLTVSSHYLEELGIDLDIVLNNGNAGFDLIDEGGGAIATDPVLGTRALLPRAFSRLGFTPAVPALGNATNTASPSVNQPFLNSFLVPQRTGGSGGLFTPVPVRSGVLEFTDPSSLPSDISGSFAGQTIGPALNIIGSFLDNIQVDFLIRATQADSRTNVMTAPRLVVFNGGSAWVAVTIQQNFVSQLNPVIAQQAVAQQPQTGVIDAGASLFVRATVTQDRRYVMLLLAPGVTRLLALQTFPFSGGTGAGDAFIQLPTLSSQRLQTMVSVPDGGTLLIGGQKLASETEVEAGVPILSKIPILKRAYTARTTVKDEQTLLILVKPKILIHSEQEELAFPSFASG